MRQLSPQGQHVVNDLSQRHGFNHDAVTQMMFAVLDGNGGMAQFSHPDFGGSGQWMRGGMMMLGDMFNHGLKSRVDALCQDISSILSNQPGLLQSGSFQSQSQSGSGQQHQSTGKPTGQSSLFVPDPEEHWWPTDLGTPNATGNQNSVRYAYFANIRRLAVKTGSQVWIYDTLNHQIGGFSQQQGSGSSITFSSQFGTVELSSLPVVTRNGQPIPTALQSDVTPAAASSQIGAVHAASAGNVSSGGDVLAILDSLVILVSKSDTRTSWQTINKSHHTSDDSSRRPTMDAGRAGRIIWNEVEEVMPDTFSAMEG
ncbi:MAG: SHOCT domain-containing protein [Pirellula sp.]|nr:SHOCT domain-containing protein [Pirellula sp.]